MNLTNVANRNDFAVVPVKGFNPKRIKDLKQGMEITLGGEIAAAAVMDKDYRCDGERNAITEYCASFCNFATIHRRKEIENFLFVPAAMDRAAARRVTDQAKRTGDNRTYCGDAASLLDKFADEKESYVTSQYLKERRRFERINSPTVDEATGNEAALNELKACWSDASARLEIIPGKEAVSMFNQHLQAEYGVTVTPTAIVDAMRVDEIPIEMQQLMKDIVAFTQSKVE
jgi:hypothetical protein